MAWHSVGAPCPPCLRGFLASWERAVLSPSDEPCSPPLPKALAEPDRSRRRGCRVLGGRPRPPQDRTLRASLDAATDYPELAVAAKGFDAGLVSTRLACVEELSPLANQTEALSQLITDKESSKDNPSETESKAA